MPPSDPLADVRIGRDDLEKLMRLLCEDVQRWCSDHGKSLMPKLLVSCKPFLTDGFGPEELVYFALNVDFNEDEEKRPLLKKLARQLYEQKKIPTAAVLASEAWWSVPRHDPARKEVAIVFGLTLDKAHSAMVTAPIGRDKDEGIWLGPFEDIRWGAANGLLECFFRGFAEANAAKIAQRN